MILGIFDTGIKSMQDINQVEQKLLPHLCTGEKMCLKATVKPAFRPIEPNPDDKRELPDEDTWVFDEYDKLRQAIVQIVQPLDDYIKTYERF